MKFKIINYYKNKEEKFPYKEYYIYDISPIINNGTIVKHIIYSIRYSNLEKFHENLLKKFPNLYFLIFPEKFYFFNQKNINKRIIDLENYLNNLLSLNEINVENFLKEFLEKYSKNEDFNNTPSNVNNISNSNTSTSLNKEIINNFLNDLKNSKGDYNKTIQDFENKLKIINFNKEEIYKLFFGDIGKKNGLLDFMGKNLKENQYSNFSILQFISNLIDCEYNENYEIYKNVLQLISINKIIELNFDYFLQLDYLNITDKIFIIIRNICDNNKIEFKDCFKGNNYKKYYEMYQKWLDEE